MSPDAYDIGPFEGDSRIHYGDDQAAFFLNREVRPVHVIARFTIDGEPVSKSRARFTMRGSKVHAYTPEKTHAAEQAVAWKFRQSAPKHTPDGTNTYGVMAIFFAYSRQRRDVDNMLKLICDGLNGVAWADDVQVSEIAGRRGATTEKSDARTEVLIYRLGPVERRTMACEHCGKQVDTFDSWAGSKRFCTQACHMAWRRERRTRTCPGCSTVFTPSAANQTQYCSAECHLDSKRKDVTCDHCGASFSKQRCHVRATNYCTPECQSAAAKVRRSTRMRGTCETCGAGTTRKEYVRCNSCRLAGAPASGKPRPTEAT